MTGWIRKGLAALMAGLMMLSGIPAGKAAAEGTSLYVVFVEVSYEGNLFFNRYDADVYLDGFYIGTAGHGKIFSAWSTVEPGQHTLAFYHPQKSSIAGSTVLLIEANSTVSCTIHSYDNRIEVKRSTVTSSLEGVSAGVIDLVGRTVASAALIMQEAGFTNVTWQTMTKDALFDPAGWIVIRQSVAPGTLVDRTSPIEFECQRTEEFFTERLAGLTAGQAGAVLKEMGYTAVYSNYSGGADLSDKMASLGEEEAAFWIVKQARGTWMDINAIELLVLYTGSLTVPDTSGLLLKDALARFKNAGFTNISYGDDNGGAIWDTGFWTVTGQNLAAGSKTAADSQVILVCRKNSGGQETPDISSGARPQDLPAQQTDTGALQQPAAVPGAADFPLSAQQAIAALGSMEGITEIAAATSQTDPTGLLGTEYGFTDAVYFACDGIDQLAAGGGELVTCRGVRAGGCIELFRTPEAAMRRAQYLQQIGPWECGSAAAAGHAVIRLSPLLSLFEQNSMENRLLIALGMEDPGEGEIPATYDGLLALYYQLLNQKQPSAAATEPAQTAAGPPALTQEEADAARKKAQVALSTMALSRSGLIFRLTQEGYSAENAAWIADSCGANWFRQAVLSAGNHLGVQNYTREELIQVLVQEGFTRQEAEAAADAVGY